MHCTLAALCALCGFTLASGLNSAQLADVLLKQDHLEHSRAVKAVHRGTFDLHTDSRNTPTTVTYEGFFSRLQESFGAFIGGVILIIFSFPVLWFNESRSARMESLASWGETQCRSVSGQTVDEENRDWLVHIQSAQASGVARMSDARFDVMFERGYLRLQSTVEVYQIVEHEKKEEKEKFGGGKETITTYTYTEEWSSIWHDSSSYRDRSKQNSKPIGLDLGSRTVNCSRVEYGEAFLLTEQLVEQFHNFDDAAAQLEDSVKCEKGGVSFTKAADNYFYFRKEALGASSAAVGDARVRFECVKDCTASVVALQVETAGDKRDSFLPYRLISRPLCGRMSEEEEKAALRKLAARSKADLASEAQVGTGCLWCLCCACNVVNWLCAGLLTPEIYHLFPGNKDKSACFSEIRLRAKVLVWVLRLVGWLMLFIGFYALFQPFLTLIKVIPLLGPILSKVGGALIWVICGVGTLAVASVIVCLAYLFFHPLVALCFSLIAALVVVVPIVLINAL